MTEQIILAGFGGQGVLLAGQIIAYAGMNEGKNVSWLPSYGPEMRGGTANCNVVVSDEEVGSPVVVEADCLIVMNRPSLEKYEKDLKPGGLLLLDSDLIEIEPTRSDIKVIKVPANSLAEQAGSIKAANMVMLGAYNACAHVVQNKTIIECLEKIMGEKKAHLIPMNEQALELGAQAAK
ncbi:2-oxoacid:acceptor oxidoreductase family protein [Christensenella tenuis]|jgi:2-oxoglutarate ferredoxin oxidoreductase subunit gamma|uniref:2-oxoacid:acceptor oxidoreductase family protein n=1 Tax=Christensenella tenuis TaxID=2763033 RepID=A0ABR7EE80_9FIRM|nr:2-oxoacid:acceptor oxidoreductase family protein [Christensenella tenuis]MBC5648087.1 2-oxoacid:acceptor oxidoreductase family protein [Christensenella tenuis]